MMLSTAIACAAAVLLIVYGAGVRPRSPQPDRGRSFRSTAPAHGEAAVGAKAPVATRSLAAAASASPEGATEPDRAVIEFTGGGHFDTTRWNAYSGLWGKQRILRRPSWQKTTRCTSPDSCEECWEGNSCWSAGSGSRFLSVPSAGNYSRFVSSIHVRCDTPILTVRYSVLGVRRGELRLRWNGKDVSHGAAGMAISGLAFPVRDVDNSYLARNLLPHARTGSVDIMVERQGANLLDLEFVAYGTGAAGAELASLELQMPENYAQCEDFKACLDPLAAGTPGAIRLRNSNALQLSCLEAEVPSDIDCARWLGCLSPQRRSQLTTLLRAAGVGDLSSPLAAAAPAAEVSTGANATGNDNTTTTATSTTTSYAASSAAGASRTCINPLLEDVESWSCDCFGEMQLRCRHAAAEHGEDACMRAQICEHPAVCAEWKAASCGDASLAAVRDALHGAAASERRLKQSLLSRARAPAAPAEGASVVDRALGNKHCA